MAIAAPDLAVQQEQLQRQQALAQALREQSMAPIDAGQGRASWTQGLAKIAQALAGRSIQSKADQQQIGLAQQQAAALRAMFGGGQQSAPVPATAGAPPPSAAPASPPIASGGQPGFADSMGSTLSGMTPEDGSAPPPAPPPSPVPASPPAPGTPPAVSPSAGGGNSPGPWSLSGNQGQDYASYVLNPEKYGEAVIASHTPTDLQKQMNAAGIDPNSALGRQFLQQNLAKQNMIAPVAVRPGGVLIDPVTHQPVFQGAQVPEGYKAHYGADGTADSINAIAGGPQAVQSNSAAKAFGGAAGDIVQVYDPSTGQMVYKPKQQVLQGGPGGAGFAAGAPMGAQAAADVTGKNSANAFQAISDGAADVPNRIYALHQMGQIVANPKTLLGPGSEGMNHVAGVLGTLTGTPPPSVTNQQEFSKWAAQYSARSAQELGLSGSDARVQIAIHATPNGEMTKPALAQIIPQMVGLETAKQGYANAAVAYQRSHGAADVQAFRTQWNQVYDPRIYTSMSQGPAAVKALLANAHGADRAALIHKSQVLAQMGALPQ